jgi:hypothetical protein
MRPEPTGPVELRQQADVDADAMVAGIRVLLTTAERLRQLHSRNGEERETAKAQLTALQQLTSPTSSTASEPEPRAGGGIDDDGHDVYDEHAQAALETQPQLRRKWETLRPALATLAFRTSTTFNSGWLRVDHDDELRNPARMASAIDCAVAHLTLLLPLPATRDRRRGQTALVNVHKNTQAALLRYVEKFGTAAVENLRLFPARPPPTRRPESGRPEEDDTAELAQCVELLLRAGAKPFEAWALAGNVLGIRPEAVQDRLERRGKSS